MKSGHDLFNAIERLVRGGQIQIGFRVYIADEIINPAIADEVYKREFAEDSEI